MISESIRTILKDFILDLVGTFPELTNNNEILNIVTKPDGSEESYEYLFEGFEKVATIHMIDIIQENEDLFKTPCELLPGIDFSTLWHDNISDTTKQSIWKYLKLLILNVIGMDDMEEKIKTAFSGKDKPTLPNLDEFATGKLGTLAKEIMHDTLGDDPEKSEEVFKDMMKDPKKLFSLMHTVGDKVTDKISSGQLKESELLEEATNMMSKLKEIPGMENYAKMFGKNSMGATQSKISESLKRAKMAERMREKLQKKQAEEPVLPVVTPKKKKKKKKKAKEAKEE